MIDFKSNMYRAITFHSAKSGFVFGELIGFNSHQIQVKLMREIRTIRLWRVGETRMFDIDKMSGVEFADMPTELKVKKERRSKLDDYPPKYKRHRTTQKIVLIGKEHKK